MLRRLIGDRIRLVIHTAPDLAGAWADAGQMEQVVMNLVLNARDAIENCGEIVIETRNVETQGQAPDELPVVSAANDAQQSGPHVMLSVSDTGVGITPEEMSRIFEPFFTTKPVGKGTGLGLPTAYGIVTQAGGHITVDSLPGQGACFRVYLPAAAAPAKEKRPAPSDAAPPENPTILVCEDEDMVRRLTRRTLEAHGYTVLEAQNGPEALDMASRPGSRIHVLITDVMMPEMNGRELAYRIKGRYPDLRGIFISGYTSDVLTGDGLLGTGTAFLEKPFHPVDLLNHVRRALDEDAGPLDPQPQQP
jgi:CheY-like chemotaxis protein